jgi:hypothetical protein
MLSRHFEILFISSVFECIQGDWRGFSRLSKDFEFQKIHSSTFTKLGLNEIILIYRLKNSLIFSRLKTLHHTYIGLEEHLRRLDRIRLK